ncbi:BA14K family protein [Bradyrhizobium symbiodeficiens]|uniref:Lectin-like protein BA14k n=1 Tax=Bradyrhizobium symbiodeficiens TaxID=1404367 RepID=A0ABZ2F266_9BRAD
MDRNDDWRLVCRAGLLRAVSLLPLRVWWLLPSAICCTDWLRCAGGGRPIARFRSFDPISGTYLGRDGRRHYCR